MENKDNTNTKEKDNEASCSTAVHIKKESKIENDVKYSYVTRQLYDPKTRKFSSVVIGNKGSHESIEDSPRVDYEVPTLNTLTTSCHPITPPSNDSRTDKSTKVPQGYTATKATNSISNSNQMSSSSKNPQSNFCNNCGRVGHIFQQCKQPITSIGIIAFRYNNKQGNVTSSGDLSTTISGHDKEKENPHDKYEYLMINRTHSLGYVEFMRGKYPVYNFDYLINIFNEMTLDEKSKIRSSTFTQLWKDLWGDFIGQQYRNEEKTSREKFNILKLGVDLGSTREKYSIENLIIKSNEHVQWKDTEWGFPKGRRNFQEKDLACAYREFEEETGYNKRHLHLIQNIMPFEEIFTGSNMKSYKHKYFLAYMEPESSSCTFPSEYHSSEVGEMKWLSYKECVENMRPYNIEKIDILKKINKLLYNFSIHYAIQ